MTHLFKEVEMQNKVNGEVVVGIFFFLFFIHDLVVIFFSVNFKVFS